MIDANYIAGLPKDFGHVCTIYPPTVREVLTNDKFNVFTSLLTQDQDDINEQNKTTDVTPFQFLMAQAQNKSFEKIISEAIEFYIHEPVVILVEKQLIIIGSPETLSKITNASELRYINCDNYFAFQNEIRLAAGREPVAAPDPNESPIARRIREGRRRVERAKAKSNRKGLSLGEIFAAIYCMGIGITPLNIGEMSYMAINKIVAIYQQKEKYDIDIRTLLAGGDPKKTKPRYWFGEDDGYQDITL